MKGIFSCGKEGREMKSDAERKFEFLVKDMVENTDFEKDMNRMIRKEGLDQIPEFDFLNKKNTFSERVFQGRNPRFLKIAGFILAVFVVSSAMTIAVNSDFAAAGKFKLDNLVFNIKNGFLTSDARLTETPLGAELFIEDETQIAIGKNYLKELKIPEYIPEGYTFSSLQITNNPQGDYVAIYTYENEANNGIGIIQEKYADYNAGVNLMDVTDEFYIDDAHVFYSPSILSENNSIYAFTGSDQICIIGPLSLDELTNIFKMLKE